jgi:hypothetical protein
VLYKGIMDQANLSNADENSSPGKQSSPDERPFFYSDAPVPRALGKLRDKLSANRRQKTTTGVNTQPGNPEDTDVRDKHLLTQ